MGLCPRLLGMVDDDGWQRQTTRMADEYGSSRRREIAIKSHTKCHVI